MKQSFAEQEPPASDDKMRQFFREIKADLAEEKGPEEGPRTGAGAMHEWEAEKDKLEEKRRAARN